MQTHSKNSLSNHHRALITGASSGIGEEYARQLAAKGCDLVIAARRIDRLEKLAAQIQNTHPGVQVEVIASDLSVPGAAEKLFAQATAGDRPVTILINNAGVGKWNEFHQTPIADLQSTMQINMVAVTELTHFAVKHMLALNRECFINQISSIASFQPVRDFAVYAGTKSYVTAFSEIVDAELAGTKVSVSVLCPGGTLTEFLDHAGQVLSDRGRLGMMTSKKCAEIGIHGMFARKRLVIPGVMNQLACFLARVLPRRLLLAVASGIMRQAVRRAA